MTVSKDDANYRDRSTIQNEHCGQCSMFVEPNSCTKVDGTINSSGWCRYFDRAEVEASDVEKANADYAIFGASLQHESALGKMVRKAKSPVAASAKHKEPLKMADSNLNFFMPIVKMDQKKQMIYGYASTECEDSDGERIALDAVKSALPDYMKWANIREMHKLSAVGTTKEANVDQKGLYIGAHISDSSAWQKCVDGVYKGFSIGGRKLEKKKNLITKLNMTEISIVDRPANPECDFNIAKMDKSGWTFTDGIELKKVKKTAEEKALSSFAKVSEFLLAKAAPAGSVTVGVDKDPTDKPDDKRKPVTNDPNSDANTDNVVGKEGGDGADDAAMMQAKKKRKAAKRAWKMAKREFSAQARRDATSSGDAMPGGKFPIKNQKDLDNAVGLAGNSTLPKAQVQAHIRAMARKHGLKLPASYSKVSGSAEPAFLTLGKSAGAGIEGGEVVDHDTLSELELVAQPKKAGKLQKGMSTAGDLAFCFDSIRRAQRHLLLEARAEGGDMKDKALAKQLGSAAQTLAEVIGQKAAHEGQEALDLSDVDDHWVMESLGKDFEMAQVPDNLIKFEKTGNPLSDAILGTIAKAAQPTRAMRMKSAGSNMKKARASTKEACKAIKAAHNVMKAAYIAKMNKAAKKPKDDGDDDDMDFGKVMGELNKAYSAMKAVGVFSKAASMQLKKAAGRSGQKTEEPSHGNAHYQVPPSVVKDLSSSDLATAGPGGDARGSAPPLQALDKDWGKLAKMADKDGKVDLATAAILMENAKLVAENEALGRRPASGRAPYAFDLTKVAGDRPGSAGGDPLMKAVKDSGVDPSTLMDSELARGSVIGHYMLNTNNAKSVLDSGFRGGVGVKS